MGEQDVEIDDFGSMIRHSCVETVKFILDHSERETFELDDVLQMAFEIEHYITDGATVAFDCDDKARKFVRGE